MKICLPYVGAAWDLKLGNFKCVHWRDFSLVIYMPDLKYALKIFSPAPVCHHKHIADPVFFHLHVSDGEFTFLPGWPNSSLDHAAPLTDIFCSNV